MEDRFTNFDYDDLADKIASNNYPEQDIDGMHIEVDAHLETK